MTPQQQVLAWGLATATPLIINAATRRGPDAKGLSVMLLWIWVACRVCGALYTPPESVQWYPLMDVMAGAVCLAAWRTERALWKLVLVGLFVLQLAGHTAFWIHVLRVGWPGAKDDGGFYRYVAINNTLCALELLTASSPGVWHVARRFGDRLSRHLGQGRQSGAQPWR